MGQYRMSSRLCTSVKVRSSFFACCASAFMPFQRLNFFAEIVFVSRYSLKLWLNERRLSTVKCLPNPFVLID